jgi:hypothetical protein
MVSPELPGTFAADFNYTNASVAGMILPASWEPLTSGVEINPNLPVANVVGEKATWFPTF